MKRFVALAILLLAGCPLVGAQAAPPREWTFMIFANATDPVLTPWIKKNIKALEQVGTTDKVALVAELGTPEGAYLLQPQKGSTSQLGFVPNADMGDYRTVTAFIKFAKTKFPAKRYLLVLAGHGMGVIDSVPAAKSRGLLPDQRTGSYVRTTQLKTIFTQAGGVDLLITDLCLMQMAEVAYELKDHTKAIIGSEETSLVTAIGYRNIANLLNRSPGVPLEEIGRDVLAANKKFFTGQSARHSVKNYGTGETLSYLDSAKLADLPARLDDWTQTLLANKEYAAIRYAALNALRFNLYGDGDKERAYSFYTDLYDLANKTEQQAVSAQARAASARLKNYLTAELVKSNVAMYNGYEVCGGLSIMMPMRTPAANDPYAAVTQTPYAALALSRDSQWDEFTAIAAKIIAGERGYAAP